MNGMPEGSSSAAKNGRNPGTGYAISGILAMLATTSAAAVYPDYSIRNDAISYLGGSGVKTEFFWDFCVLIAGILWIYSTYLLSRKSGIGYSAGTLYLAGIGFLLVGSSPWNLFQSTHYIGAQLIFIFGSVSSIVVSFTLTSGTFARISRILGVLSIAAYVSEYFGSDYILGPGGMERMVYYPVLLWSIAFGAYLINRFQ